MVDGVRAVVGGEVMDIGRRINEGDPTVGWPGDPSMALCVDTEEYLTDAAGRPTGVRNPKWGWFEVWGTDAHGEVYLAASAPRCDAGLLRKLAEGHWSRGNPFDRVVAENRRRQADQDRVERDRREETIDKLHLALRKDLGAYEGGLTRRIY